MVVRSINTYEPLLGLKDSSNYNHGTTAANTITIDILLARVTPREDNTYKLSAIQRKDTRMARSRADEVCHMRNLPPAQYIDTNASKTVAVLSHE